MKDKELRPWEVAKMIEEAGEPVQLEVWSGNEKPELKLVHQVDTPSNTPYKTIETYLITVCTCWFQHARLPQKPERRKITDRYRLMKRCRELDAQGNGILVRVDGGGWYSPQVFGFTFNPNFYQYTHLDDDGQPTGEPQDFWEEV